MKKRSKKLLVILFIACAGHGLQAQDAVFSQFYAAEMYLNPAMVGVEEYITLGLNHRNQYRSIIEPYVTSQASLILPIYTKERDRHLGGIGISAYNDHAGDHTFSTDGVMLNAAYNLPLSKASTLSFGVQGGFTQKRIDLNNFQWGSQFCLACPGNNNGVSPSFDPAFTDQSFFPDISAGVLYYLNSRKDYEEVKGWSAYMGVSAFHMNRPDESLLEGQSSTIPILFKGHGGVEFNLNNHLNLSPNFLVAMQQDAMQVNVGSYLTFLLGGLKAQKDIKWQPSFLTLGVWHRIEDAFIFSAGFGNYIYSVGLSYDLNTSNLRFSTEGRGAFEISLKLRIPKEKRERRYYTPIM